MVPWFHRRALACACLLLISIFVIGCGGLREGGHDLRGGAPVAGSVVRAEMRFAMAKGNILITVGDRAIQGRMDMTGLQITEGEVVAVAGDRPSRVRMRFVTDRMNTRQAINGAMNEESERGALAGSTVIGERVADRWRFTLAEGSATKSQAQAMHELGLGFGAEFYPDRLVAVGETWEVPANSVKRWLGHELIRSEGTATLRLEAITRHAGERCAKVAVEISAGGKLKDPDGNDLELWMGLEGHIFRSLDSHVDVAGELTGLMILEGEVRRDGTMIGLKVTGPVTVEGTGRRRHPVTARRD